jgi:hypothetical protein
LTLCTVYLRDKRLDMTVTQLITEAFVLARSRYPEIHKAWISTSVQLGGLLPSTLFMLSLQRAGDLDMVLRCMEDDYVPPSEGAGELSGHYQSMLSEHWIGAVYEIFRLLIERKLTSDNDAITGLAHHLRLLRIPLEKHEIAADKKLSGPLVMARYPPNNNEADNYYVYSKSDAQRAHGMLSGLSSRGSMMWQVIDLESNISYWLERRDLSERIVALWGVGAEAPVSGGDG